MWPWILGALDLGALGALGVALAGARRARRELRRARCRLRAVPTHDAQPEREDNQATAPSGRRQMTLGECIAIAELAARFDRERIADVPLVHLLRVVDAMRVCTTCGQVASHHREDAPWAGACTRYAPREF